MPIPLILGGATLLGTGALGVGGARLLKDELGFDEYGAAQQELQQGDRKGYNPKTGTINRGLIESWGDALMGNDPEEILRQTKAGHLKNLTQSKTGAALLDARPDYQITDRMTQGQIDRDYRKTTKVDPIIQQIKATGELGDRYTTQELQSMDESSLLSVLKQARSKETVSDYANNPVIQQQLSDARQDRITADKRFNATQQLAIAQMGIAQQQQANQMQIAQMNNQLQMRRQDSADRRADRRDRQAMIQQMMSGLSTLGASIAI